PWGRGPGRAGPTPGGGRGAGGASERDMPTGAGGGGGVKDVRGAAEASLRSAQSSGNVRSGTHSSKPSRQTHDSSVMAPVAGLRLGPASRTGPTGTPLMPTYHSSLLELERTVIAVDTEDASSLAGGATTAFENAPASPPGAGPAGRGGPPLGGGAGRG